MKIIFELWLFLPEVTPSQFSGYTRQEKKKKTATKRISNKKPDIL